jgi:cytochrome P450
LSSSGAETCGRAVSTAFARIRGAPILGSLLPLSRDALGFFDRLLRERGDRLWLRVPGRRVLLLCHPRDIERVLTDRQVFGRAAEIRKLRPIFGSGLLASDGELWRRQRTLIQPCFQPEALRRYTAIMRDTAGEVIRGWQAGQTLDMHAQMMRYTRETICRVLFGTQVAADRPELPAAVSIVFGELRSEILYLPLWRRLPLARSRRWNRAVLVLNRAIAGAIAARRAAGARAPGGPPRSSGAAPPDASGSGHEDLVGTLLTARGPGGEAMSDRQLHDEILTFFLAGHETAALSLTWAAYLLARHPDAQERAIAEVRSVTRGRELRPPDHALLRFTAATVKEALRLYPPVWSMGREVLADTVLDGERLAPGTDVWICLYRLQRDARWYDDPERFQPERWLEKPAPPPFTYLPFGVGARVCIGQRFALTEAVLGLATVLARWRLAPASQQPVEPSAWVTLRPKRPILLRLV